MTDEPPARPRQRRARPDDEQAPASVAPRTPPLSPFEMILAELTRDLQPQDVIDRMWVKNLAHLEQDVALLRRAKSAAIRVGMADAYVVVGVVVGVVVVVVVVGVVVVGVVVVIILLLVGALCSGFPSGGVIWEFQ